ncbi:MAG TPA: hypothetical protein VGN44_09980 [Candidatus Angelobacter sp.]
MPMESRTLHFANDEVFEALKEYGRQIGRPMPDGPGNSMALLPDTGARVTLNSMMRETTRSFTESEVAAALIMFCIKRSIPIARRSVKTLQVGNDSVLLRLDIS